MDKRGCNFFPKNRKGAHVGIILSFVIFITFVVFLYTVVRPGISTGANKATTLEYIKLKIIANVSANFTSTSVKINEEDNPNKDCVTLENFLLPPQLNPVNIKIKNEGGGMEDAYYNADDFWNLRIDREDSESTFFKVYHSPKFPLLTDGTSDCDLLTEEEYQRGLIKVDRYIFEDDLENLISYYNSSYEQLKEEFKISPADEFAFGFIKSDGTSISAGESPQTTNIYADEIPIEYIDENINIQSGFLNIKVW